jgi:hypothetical protein
VEDDNFGLRTSDRCCPRRPARCQGGGVVMPRLTHITDEGLTEIRIIRNSNIRFMIVFFHSPLLLL